MGAPLLGREPFTDGNLGKIARLALRSGALVLPFWCERRGGAHFTTRVLPALDLGTATVPEAVRTLDAVITPPLTRLIDQWYMALEFRQEGGD